MNEQRKARYNHFNPSTSDSEQTAGNLTALISSFLHRTELKPADWIVLDGLLRQLNKTNNLPRKVLRSIANKFEKIRESYQR